MQYIHLIIYKIKIYKTHTYHFDKKVLGLVTVWGSRSADFNSSFFCVGRSVIDVLSDFQLDSLPFVKVTLRAMFGPFKMSFAKF